MKRTSSTTYEGSRAELAAELKDQATGWHLRGNDRLSEAAAKGAAELRSGEREVTVGHQRYVVTE
jgi:hypothetical protein